MIRISNSFLLAGLMSISIVACEAPAKFTDVAPAENPSVIAQAHGPIIDQEQLSIMFNQMYELLMPSYKTLYINNWDDIEWVEHYYVTDIAKGDALLERIANDFIQMMKNNIDPLVEKAVENIKVGPEISKEMLDTIKSNLKEMMMQMMPTMIIQGIKQNAILKSSVYQEILAKRGQKNATKKAVARR